MRATVLCSRALLCVAGPVSAGDQVPFKRVADGDRTVTPVGPPIVSVLLEATGTASKLGRFTLQAPHIVNQAR